MFGVNDIIIDGEVCETGPASDVAYGHFEFKLCHTDESEASKNVGILVCIDKIDYARRMSRRLLPDMEVRVYGELHATYFDDEYYIRARKVEILGGEEE